MMIIMSLFMSISGLSGGCVRVRTGSVRYGLVLTVSSEYVRYVRSVLTRYGYDAAVCKCVSGLVRTAYGPGR